jgi:hypothetical protein
MSSEEEVWIPGGYTSRTMCQVLEELRTFIKIKMDNHGHQHMLGLVEEIQTIANRMECGLGEKKDYYSLMKMLRKEVKKLRGL